jgi:hypothetical protein
MDGNSRVGTAPISGWKKVLSGWTGEKSQGEFSLLVQPREVEISPGDEAGNRSVSVGV